MTTTPETLRPDFRDRHTVLHLLLGLRSSLDRLAGAVAAPGVAPPPHPVAADDPILLALLGLIALDERVDTLVRVLAAAAPAPDLPPHTPPPPPLRALIR